MWIAISNQSVLGASELSESDNWDWIAKESKIVWGKAISNAPHLAFANLSKITDQARFFFKFCCCYPFFNEAWLAAPFSQMSASNMISPCRLVVVDVDLVCGGNLTPGTTLSLSFCFPSHSHLINAFAYIVTEIHFWYELGIFLRKTPLILQVQWWSLYLFGCCKWLLVPPVLLGDFGPKNWTGW